MTATMNERIGRARRVAPVLAMIGTLAAAGCTVVPVGPQRPVVRGPVQPTPVARVEGSWADAQGRSISTLQNGAFVTRAVDTGEPFTTGGRYSYASPNEVSISYTSLVRQTQVNVNCLIVGPAQLNCTNDAGAQFQLFRRA